MDLSKLEEKLEYTFKNKQLLETALTHSSYAYEKKKKSYEKLEFLGDSILEFISSVYIYNNYSNLKEGEMTKVRATVVCENSLYKIAMSLGFSDFLLLGKSELNSNDIRKAILADSVEAIIAAMFLDGGIDPAKKFYNKELKRRYRVGKQKCWTKRL